MIKKLDYADIEIHKQEGTVYVTNKIKPESCSWVYTGYGVSTKTVFKDITIDFQKDFTILKAILVTEYLGKTYYLYRMERFEQIDIEENKIVMHTNKIARCINREDWDNFDDLKFVKIVEKTYPTFFEKVFKGKKVETKTYYRGEKDVMLLSKNKIEETPVEYTFNKNVKLIIKEKN